MNFSTYEFLQDALCFVADDAELDLLATLIEQEAEEQSESSARHTSVADVESDYTEHSAGGISTESFVDVGSNCSVNSDPVASTTEASVPETNEEC